MSIFNEEFDLATLTEAAVIKSHFMLHTNPKKFILKSWNKHQLKLVWSMLFGNFVDHMEPINLIADYYGEKQALYFAFLIHHIGQLLIPSVFGLALWFYQIYNTYQIWSDPEKETEASYIATYFASLDTVFNYPYLLILAVWSTLYCESWKRKQNTIIYLWASE